jgi:hypothetical protein
MVSDYFTNEIFISISRINYALTVLSGIVVWIISTFLFHLTALLFNGHSPFNRFLFISSYFYLIPAIVIVICIFILEDVQITNIENVMIELMNNRSFKLSVHLINYSFIPYYAMIIILIHYIYQVKYIYALLSVVIPVGSMWVIAEMFKFL